MMTRAEQKSKSRRALIDAALALSAQAGFANISLREVTRQAGLAPTSFYRHFNSMEELGLVLVKEVSHTLRHLMRQARVRISLEKSVIETSVKTFMEFLSKHGNLFHILIGDRLGGGPTFRAAISQVTQSFIKDLEEDLRREGTVRNISLDHIPLIAELCVTVVFNLGIEVLKLPPEKHQTLIDRLIMELRIIFRGAEAMTMGWEPGRAKSYSS